MGDGSRGGIRSGDLDCNNLVSGGLVGMYHTSNSLTFVKTTAIAYGQKSGRGLRILVYAIAVGVFENVRELRVSYSLNAKVIRKRRRLRTRSRSLMARMQHPKSIKKSGVKVGAFSGYDTFASGEYGGLGLTEVGGFFFPS